MLQSKHCGTTFINAMTVSSEHGCVLGFQVLYGKVKKIAPSLDWNKTQDPTVGFDCHMCTDAVSHRDTLHQQVLGSSVS